MQNRNYNNLTKAEFVYTSIKESILSGEYEQNEKLVIRNIAENFNMSDIPVREAMKKLEAENLVTIVPHVGAVVNSISYKEMEEWVELREVLEPFAARLAASKVKDKDIKALNELIDAMENSADKNDYQTYGRLNKEFHETIYSLSGNQTLIKIIHELWGKTERLRAIFRSEPNRMKESNNEHKKIVDLLSKGDAEQVEQLIKHQRMRSTKRYLALIKSMQDGVDINHKKK